MPKHYGDYDTKAKDSYTHLEIEAALCVWEEMLRINGVFSAISERHPMEDFWEDMGAATMRHLSINIGRDFLEVFDKANAEEEDRWDDLSYDWDVIPAMFGALVWDANGVTVPDAEVLIAAVDALRHPVPKAAGSL